MKVYELKKGDQIIYKEEIITFEEIKGDKAVFYNEWGEKFEFDDFLYIYEIGEIFTTSSKNYDSYPTLF